MSKTAWRVVPADLFDEVLTLMRRPGRGAQLDLADARNMTAVADMVANVADTGAFVQCTETRGGKWRRRIVRLPRV